MSSAAITLQCPACGGVFLTLQQGTGGAEICPHCSMSAPRSRYREVEPQSSPGARTVLPPRKKDQPASQPIPLAPSAYYGPTVAPEPAAMPPPPVRQQAQPFNAGQGYRPSQATGPVPIPYSAPPAVSGPVPIPISYEPPPGPVISERVPLPPPAPGELPLPSRVLQAPDPAAHASYVAAHQEVQSGPVPAAAAPVPAASPFYGSPEPAASPYFAASPEPAASPFFAEVPDAPIHAPPPSVPREMTAPMMAAPVIPPLEVSPASTPSYGYSPIVGSPQSQPLPQPQPPPSYYSPQPVNYYTAAPVTTPAPVPLPESQAVAPAPVVAAPAPISDSAQAAKASPAQLWEAAILQHNQPQEHCGALTGRELFPAGAGLAYQPAPPPLGPLVPTPGAASPVVAPTLPPPVPVQDTPPAAVPTRGERPLVTGTVLPVSRSMPPAVLPAGFGVLPAFTSSEEPLPPPQIGFPPESQSARPNNASATSLPPTPFGMAATGSPLTPPLPPPPGLSVQSAPLIPHAVQLRDSGNVVNLGPVPEGSPQHAASQDLTLVETKRVRNGGPPPPAHLPRRRLPWIAGLLLGSLALAGGLHLLKDTWTPATQANPASPVQASNTQTPTLPAPASTDTTTPLVATTTGTPAPTTKDAEAVTTPTALTPPTTPPLPSPPEPAPPPAPAPAQEEVRRAMPSDAATLSITQEDPLPAIATKLMFGIDAATSPEERARWIANPEQYAANMERLLRTRGGRLNTREVTPLPAPVYALPTGEEVPLFRVSSPASRGGAILRLHPQNGAYVIDWPLFAQTYDNAFDRFVATNRAIPGKAEWYTVLCSLVGDPASKEGQRETHLRLQVQGSLAETGSTEAWVEKTSPVGRYLLKEMAPRRMYLVEMQFSASDAGSRRLMVLDCDATRGESAQANANK